MRYRKNKVTNLQQHKHITAASKNKLLVAYSILAGLDANASNRDLVASTTQPFAVDLSPAPALWTWGYLLLFMCEKIEE